MRRIIEWGLAGAILAASPSLAYAEKVTGRLTSARELLQGCLKPPGPGAAAELASAVGAKPYSDLRQRRELKTSTSNYEEPITGRDQRTKQTVTTFRGWDLPGPGAGTLEYEEARTETDWVDRPTRQSMTPVRAAHTRTCRLEAPVANARSLFELYESLTAQPYGIRISADRRWIDIFMFDGDTFDIELMLVLEAPLAGIAPEPAQQEGRLILSDGGPRFVASVQQGISTVTTTRSAMLAGLDRPAAMVFVNTEIQVVVQRLTERSKSRRPEY